MVNPTKSITLTIGVSKLEFVINWSPELGDSVDVAISLTIPVGKHTFQSMPTIVFVADLVRLAEYVQTSLNDEPGYPFVPMNLGFELSAFDNDGYVTTIQLFLLAAEPENTQASYVGCRGPVLNDALEDFAQELKRAATI